MRQAKRASKGKRPGKAVSVLGIAGVSFAASTGGSPAEMPSASLAAPTARSAVEALWRNTAAFQVPTLDEEEISDVSLATFHLLDKDDLGNLGSVVQLAAFRAGGCGCGHGGGCRGCGGRGCAEAAVPEAAMSEVAVSEAAEAAAWEAAAAAAEAGAGAAAAAAAGVMAGAATVCLGGVATSGVRLVRLSMTLTDAIRSARF